MCVRVYFVLLNKSMLVEQAVRTLGCVAQCPGAFSFTEQQRDAYNRHRSALLSSWVGDIVKHQYREVYLPYWPVGGSS